MADYNSSLPVRTQTNGDVVSKLCDGTNNTQLLAIDSNGKIIVKLDDAAGNGITSQVNGLQQALDVGINVLGVQIDPRSIRALTSADIVSVVQSTSPWATKDQADGPVAPGTVALFSQLCGGQYNSTLPTLTNTQQAALQVDASGRLLVVTSMGTLSEDHNYGAVGANTLRTAAQIGNALGAADFGAGATGAQTLRTVANQGGTWSVRAQDGAGNALTSQSNGGQQALDVGINVLGVQIDPRQIRALTSSDVVSANIRDASGSAFSATNPLPVVFSQDPIGTEINDYFPSVAVAAGGTANHDYPVTALKTLLLKEVWASASGKMKIEVQIESGVGTGVFATKFVGFNSTANPNITIELPSPITVLAGVRVRVIRTNKDNQSQDLYSTISGNEV